MSDSHVEKAGSIADQTRPVSGRRRLKVLVGAYACSPPNGSEGGIGWGWVEAISKYHDLWVLTSDQCRQDIETELARRPELQSRMRFYYVPRERYLRAERIWPPFYLYTYKHQWQKAAYEAGKRLHGEIGFDVVHQMTYTSFRVPGMLWHLDVPFVWGPIGALEQTTWALIPALGLRGALHFLARNLWNDWDRRFSRTPRLAFDKADGGIIAATAGTRKEIRRFYGHESTVICENGLPPITRGTPVRRLPSEPLHLLWCGHLIPRKALPFLFSALQLLPPRLKWKLTIIGDGPCAASWYRLAQVKGISDRCEWLGQVTREMVLRRMQTAHTLVVTSVYDLVSSVVVEALANGLPIICPDHCGFKDAITSECGIKVPATSKRQLVEGLSDAICLLLEEDRRWELARGALARSSAYHWEAKARALDEIYHARVRRAAIGNKCFGPATRSTTSPLFSVTSAQLAVTGPGRSGTDEGSSAAGT
jgi:glycosyltransferase involved in cell wall biosynthesis